MSDDETNMGFPDPEEEDTRADEDTQGDAMIEDEVQDGVQIIPEGQATTASERTVKTTTRYMTKFERARILGVRALQISMNAPVMVEVDGESDPLQIAIKELHAKKIPLVIRRYLPDGTYEDWPINELETR
eukprot:TRINITY_DN15637_c0_g1_i2.p2 TRINITY_DN15637_c0_g1~~TRINITY_DN15637_c0_g1_i2.p2  ORF type:complete len:131 (+),score=22.83 TRINITY_DN15637_c0_g1_i2:174-566(+)